MEQPTHACSDQPATPASKNARYTISWRRPSNRSSRLALPLGPSNAYSFSTASHGIRRRSAASASRARVSSFSFTSSCWRAASHSCGDTIGGVFIARYPPFGSGPRSCARSGVWARRPSRTQMPSEGVEARVPVAGQRWDELLHDLNRGRLEPVADATPLAGLGDDQPGLSEQTE